MMDKTDKYWRFRFVFLIAIFVIIVIYALKVENYNAYIAPTPTPTPQQPAQPTPEPQAMPKYDIPLGEDIQTYIYNKCKDNGISYELVLKIISVESDFNPNCISYNSDSVDVGLMQINSGNRQWMKDALGITDLLNTYNNIDCGIYILKCGYGEDLHKTLMSYNMGIGTTNKLFKQGVYSSKYSRLVLSKDISVLNGYLDGRTQNENLHIDNGHVCFSFCIWRISSHLR